MKRNYFRKRLILYISLLSLIQLLFAHRILAQTPGGGGPGAPVFTPYQTGELLSYNVSFSTFQSAAHVELFVAERTTLNNLEAIELRAHVETIDVVSAALYAINVDHTSFVDSANGLPLRTQQVIRNSGRTSEAGLDFAQPAGASAFAPSENRGRFPGTYDFLSALYRLRSLPLAQGASYRFTVRGAGEQYDAELQIKDTELLKTNVGSFNALVGQVRVRDNKAADNFHIRIYFSNDERRIPLLITARHPAGEIRAEIASATVVNQNGPTVPSAIPPTPNTPPRPFQRAIEATSLTKEAPAPDLPFKAGEQLNFTFFLAGMPRPVGTLALQVRARAKYFNRDGMLFTAAISTTNDGQRLFPINNQINSYVDATSLLPFRTELRLHENRRRNNWVVNVDQNRGAATFDDQTRLEMPIGTHDLISVLYALRSFDLTPPKRNAVSILINKRPRTLYVSSLQRETVQMGAQKIPAIQLALMTNETNGDRLQLRLWVSADRRKLPLRLVANTPLGPIRADLAIIPVQAQ